MRSVQEIQIDIDQVTRELESARAELNQLEASTPDEYKTDREYDPEWSAGRMNYINNGDMSGIEAYWNRKDQQKRDALESKRLEQERERLEQERKEASEEVKEKAKYNWDIAAARYEEAKKNNINVKEAEINKDKARSEYMKAFGEDPDKVPTSVAVEGNVEPLPPMTRFNNLKNKGYVNGKITEKEKADALKELEELETLFSDDEDTRKEVNAKKSEIAKMKTKEAVDKDKKKQREALEKLNKEFNGLRPYQKDNAVKYGWTKDGKTYVVVKNADGTYMLTGKLKG